MGNHFAENHGDIQEVTTDAINARAAAEGRLAGNGSTSGGDLCTVPEQGIERPTADGLAHRGSWSQREEGQTAGRNMHSQAASSQCRAGARGSRWTVAATKISATYDPYWTGDSAAQPQSDTKMSWGG